MDERPNALSVSSDQNRTVCCQSSSQCLIYVWCASSLPSVADWSVESFQGLLGCLFSRKLCLLRCLQKPRMLLFLYVRVNKKRRHKGRGRRWEIGDVLKACPQTYLHERVISAPVTHTMTSTGLSLTSIEIKHHLQINQFDLPELVRPNRKLLAQPCDVTAITNHRTRVGWETLCLLFGLKQHWSPQS